MITPPSAAGAWARIRRNAAIILGERFVFGLVGLGATAIAVRAVGLEAFGIVALLQAYVRLIAALIRFESWAAVTRYGAGPLAAGDLAACRRLMGFTLRLDLLAFAVSLVLSALAAPLAARLLHWPEAVADLAPWYAISIIFITGATPTGFLRLIDRFGVLAEQHALNAVLRLAGATAILTFGGGVVALAWVWAGAGIVSGAYMMAIAWVEARRRDLLPQWRGRWSELGAGFPRLWQFMLITNVTGVLETVLSHLSVLVVGAMMGPTGASLYSLVRQLTESLGKLNSLLGPIVFPEIAWAEARGDRRAIGRLVRRSLRLLGAILAGMLALVALVAEPLLRLLFGPEAVAAAPLLLTAGAGACLSACGFALVPAMLSLGRERAVLRTALVAAAVFLPLLVGGAWLLGLLGVGLALLAWQATLFLGRLAVLRAALRGA